MKKLSFCTIVLLILLSGCKTVKPVADTNQQPQPEQPVSEKAQELIKYSDPTTWVLGYFNLSRLTMEPHNAWYISGYDSYEFNSEAVNNLLDISKEGLKIKIVMGTWCPDSRREVPRFMRILDQWQFPLSDVIFIGVDNAKLSPVGEYESLNIQRVPTFIIYKNNIEAGRIIENPVTSLEQDMVNILKGMNNSN
jgi:thiol-disulfide isomerase/thioredoxin